ncbi:CpaD family pilus assembly protein [Hephaestia sp. GCM10023244]|uniref:CpaD family pilus assembly protein n=1 Tax=unclassified Hephaestia TaxID=2631281 RepID=UPI0020773B84|nr:CpaD family pilus assembly protein [Hephaestia sp. MAHUQ-44]MCM8729440.1 CpaD family pilus assembly protein [Hephaestia sp. MAHUQ-44]
MSKRSLTLALALPALLLAGCGGTVNRGLESVHQPVVTRADYAFDLSIANGHLATGEARRLDGWLASLNVGYGDSVGIDDPSPYATPARDEIAQQVARYGLLVADVPAVSLQPLTPDTMRVVVTRMTAAVPGCPDFSRLGNHEFSGSLSSNFGCAVNSNLAAMVARPQDLVRGQPGAPSVDPATATKAIQTFRTAKPTGANGLQSETTGGK